ncbi:hypothetical protein PV327_004018 [Microctonus hyperodae]|uniref:Uncharacterized protein n=1 Tax=Microctonus hyperodae TaxID=165561 RepID=A0AA39L1M9_MICHY|nr:hypothetical protein PV327_004018 [Microctonus hyperodae]
MQMLFLWSKEPEPNPPRGNPWFAWLTTIIFIWGCRRRILTTFSALSPLGLLRNLNVKNILSIIQAYSKITHKNNQSQKASTVLRPNHHITSIRTRVKRLGTGDGLHVSNDENVVQKTQQIHYKMTRSGRIYGKYPNKIVASM